MSSDPWSKIPNLSGTRAPELEDTRSGDPSRFFPSVRGGNVDAVTGRVLNVPRCYVRQGTIQNINNSAVTGITFDNPGSVLDPPYDSDNMFSATLNTRVTIRTPGIYDVKWFVCWATNSAGLRQGWIAKNGGAGFRWAYDLKVPTAAAITTQSCSQHMMLNIGDYLELIVFQDSAAGAGFITTSLNTGVNWAAWMSVCLDSTFGSDN